MNTRMIVELVGYFGSALVLLSFLMTSVFKLRIINAAGWIRILKGGDCLNTRMIVELVGYFGSALVLLSFLMTSVFKLRIINAAGGVVCTIYALIIHAYPTALMNTCLVIINIYYLVRMRKTERAYNFIEGEAVVCTIYALIIHAYPTALMNTCLVIINIYYLVRMRKTERAYNFIEGEAQEPLIYYLLNYYKQDIMKYFPAFHGGDGPLLQYDATYIVYHNTEPAGIFLGKRKTDGEVEVALDYSTPAYRDCSVGKYLYDATYIVYHNTEPAGIFLGKRKTDGEVEVALDYSTPAYRDCSVGKYLYNRPYIVYHNTEPAGIFLGKRKTDGEVEVALDYSTPAYRDCSVGKYLYNRLREQGIRKLTFMGKAGAHESYLQTMGFQKQGEAYRKDLMKL